MRDQCYTGLTWDHPRGYAALEHLAQIACAEGDLDLHWHRQPLEGFESHPIADLAARFDLIVIDHPHLGDSISAQALRPMDELFSSTELDIWRSASVGRTFDSYHFDGRQWALPLDAATQVSVARADLLDGEVPDTWDDVLTLAQRKPVALSLAGPHAVLTLFSIAAAFGDAPAVDDPDTLFMGEGLCTAWALLVELHALADARFVDCNPIGLLEGIAYNNDVVYCPLVFGYVNYAVGEESRSALRFADAPAGPNGHRGSTLGGTGIAVSRRTDWTPALAAHIAGLMSKATQCGQFPRHGGQPGARAAWLSAEVNQSWGGFYAATLRSVEQALVRPRYRGYIAFQEEASAHVRAALAGRHDARSALAELQRLHLHHRRHP